MHTEYGNRDVAMSGEILRTVVGSGVHGIAIEGTDDHDEMGVFVEPPRCRKPPCARCGQRTGLALTPVRIRWPASTGIVTPVTLAARSELRYSAVSAMTCGSMNVVPLSAAKW